MDADWAPDSVPVSAISQQRTNQMQKTISEIGSSFQNEGGDKSDIDNTRRELPMIDRNGEELKRLREDLRNTEAIL